MKIDMEKGPGSHQVVEEAQAKEVDENATTPGKCSADKACTHEENNEAMQV